MCLESLSILLFCFQKNHGCDYLSKTTYFRCVLESDVLFIALYNYFLWFYFSLIWCSLWIQGLHLRIADVINRNAKMTDSSETGKWCVSTRNLFINFHNGNTSWNMTILIDSWALKFVVFIELLIFDREILTTAAIYPNYFFIVSKKNTESSVLSVNKILKKIIRYNK